MSESITKQNKRNGEILLGFRKQNSITQTELATMVGRDRRDISKYEKGYRAIPQIVIDYLNSEYHLKLKSTGKVVKAKNPEVDPIEVLKGKFSKVVVGINSNTTSSTESTQNTPVKRKVGRPRKTVAIAGVEVVNTASTNKSTKTTKTSKTAESKINTKVERSYGVEKSKKTFRTKSYGFAKNLILLRESMNMTQEKFAKKFKFGTTCHLRRLEAKQTTNLSIETIKALYKSGVDIYSLL